MSRPLHGHVAWWPWPWFKVTLWPWIRWKMHICSFLGHYLQYSPTTFTILLEMKRPLHCCMTWWPWPWFKVTGWPWMCQKWTFVDFSDTIYSIILKPLPSCSKPKDLYRDVWQDDLDLGSRSLGDLQILPYMDIWDVSPCWLCHSCFVFVLTV